MDKNNNNRDKLVFASETPDVQYLFYEFQRSTQNGGNTANIARNDDIRLARWAGQTDDGKKHSESLPEGEPAFPFEGASDVRCRLTDKTINELVNMLMTTFDRSEVKVSGTEINDGDFASQANVLMEWLTRNKIRSELRNEAELLAQYTEQYGFSALHIIWEQQMAVRYQTIRMDELIAVVQQALQQNPNSVLKELPNAIMNKDQRQFAADLISQFVQTLESKDVLKAVDDLRETGKAQIPEEFVSKNQPKFVALKPYDEISFPQETVNIQDARVIFRRTFMTEVELRGQAKIYGWSEEFINEAVAMAGMHSQFYDPNLIPAASLVNYQVHRNDHLIEIVYAYSRQLDSDGVQGIYQTIFCPRSGSDLYAEHGLLGYAHNKYPFVVFRRERLRRPIYESRGVPEICMTAQTEVKAQRDSIRDRTAFDTMPPILVKKRLGGINKIAPAMQLPVTSPDDYKFMPTPTGNPTVAFNLIDRVEKEIAEYFGLFHPQVMPQVTQLTQQALINNWLDVWSEAYAMAFSLMLQYMDAAEIEAITNNPLPQNASAISNMYDFRVRYDVRELDTEFVVEKLKAIMQFVMPLDQQGSIDKNKLVKAAIQAIDPDKARDIIIDQGTASQMLYKNIKSDIGLMMLGNEADYVENDPSAGSKLQYIQDIISKNPKAKQSLQSDQHFRALLDNYVKNLQMSVSQQQNKQIGRTGVTPVPQQAAQGLQGQIKQADQMQEQGGEAQMQQSQQMPQQ